MSKAIIVYGVGSPLLVDYEESLVRSDLKIFRGIQNVPGKNWASPGTQTITLDAIQPSMLKLPFIVPIFTPGFRQLAAQEAKNIGFKNPLDLIDKTSIIPRSLKTNGGLYINTGCIIGAACEFEQFVSINRGATIGHHTLVEKFASIGPGVIIGSMARIKKGSFIGGGSIILPKITIGENSIVGAGSVVTRNVPPNSLVLGNPAKVTKENISGYHNQSVS